MALTQSQVQSQFEGVAPAGSVHTPKPPQNRCTSDIVFPIDSTARNGDSVSRRRFQKGSVFLNKTKTMWIGSYAEYVLDSHGVEKRKRREVVLCPVKNEGIITRKREAQKLLQPTMDKVNSSLSAKVRERKNATFEAFAQIWERDYLSLSKPSTQSSITGHLKRLKMALGKKDMRQIDAGGTFRRSSLRWTPRGLTRRRFVICGGSSA